MEDTELYVNYTNLFSDGETIVNNCTTILENIINIDTLLDDWESWLGSDSASYVSSLKTTLIKLNKYINELNEIGSYMEKNADDYKNNVDTCVRLGEE